MELARAQSVCYIYWQLEEFTDISWHCLMEEFSDSVLEEFTESWFADIWVIWLQK